MARQLHAAIVAACVSLTLADGEDSESSCGCATSRSAGAPAGEGTCGAASESSVSSSGAARSLSSGGDWSHLSSVVLIPAGSNQVGTNTPHFPEDAEAPALPFTLHRDLWMDTYEVSNARFHKFVQATGHATEAEVYGWSFVHELAVPESVRASIEHHVQGAEWWLPVNNATWRTPEGLDSSISERMDHPALHISQRDAAAFCAWAGGRLPSESEWEYAARGGKKDRLFPWGNQLLTPPPGSNKEKDKGKGKEKEEGKVHRVNIWQGVFPMNNTGEDGYLWTAPVTSFGPQNGYGLYHITGNVWEWTSDTWCPTVDAQGQQVKPTGARAKRMTRECRLGPRDYAKLQGDPGEVDFVKRGGSFMCHKDSCYRYRVAARHKNTANSSAYNLGARCVYDRKPSWARDETSAASIPSDTTSSGSESRGEL